MAKKKPKYTKWPKTDRQLQHRLLWVLKAMLGEVDKTDAARQLGVSRTQLHNLVNQTAEALLEAVRPKSGGRPARSEREKQLEQDNERLRRDNARLQHRVDTVDRLLGVASEMMKGRIEARPRSKRRSQKTPAKAAKRGKEECDDATKLLEGALEMRQLGLSAPLAAAIVGVSPATVARWARHRKQGLLPRAKRGGGPRPQCTPAAAARARQLIRELHGAIGADTLSKTVDGISRREAGRVINETLTLLERERKAQATRVMVTLPGVLRGFDAMQLRTCQGRRYALIAADAALPYRTLALSVERYISPCVAAAVERDLCEHAAPLVYRLDRASCHRTDQVDEVLRAYGVLRLHGPPRHPGFYGQLERQNREPRDWFRFDQTLDARLLDEQLAHMRNALNSLRPRPRLGYRTAEDVWKQRPQLTEDRALLRQEVTERAARIARGLNPNSFRGSPADFAQRLAIEQALTQRGYLSCQIGGWC